MDARSDRFMIEIRGDRIPITVEIYTMRSQLNRN